MTSPSWSPIAPPTRGLSVEAYLERLAQQAAQSETLFHKPKRTSDEAVAHIRKSRKGITLGGLKIKDVIHEGPRY